MLSSEKLILTRSRLEIFMLVLPSVDSYVEGEAALCSILETSRTPPQRACCVNIKKCASYERCTGRKSSNLRHPLATLFRSLSKCVSLTLLLLAGSIFSLCHWQLMFLCNPSIMPKPVGLISLTRYLFLLTNVADPHTVHVTDTR